LVTLLKFIYSSIHVSYIPLLTVSSSLILPLKYFIFCSLNFIVPSLLRLSYISGCDQVDCESFHQEVKCIWMFWCGNMAVLRVIFFWCGKLSLLFSYKLSFPIFSMKASPHLNLALKFHKEFSHCN
jgi:hypothetical protein